MPCLPIPSFPSPPPLPSGVSLPTFTPPALPSLGLCCNIQIPPWGTFPTPLPPLSIAFPAAVVTALATLMQGVQQVQDAIAIPCPKQ